MSNTALCRVVGLQFGLQTPHPMSLAYAVNRAVNSVKNDTEECIEPVADRSRQQRATSLPLAGSTRVRNGNSHYDDVHANH